MSSPFIRLKSFKHDGSSHRMWMYLTEVKEDSEFYVLGAKNARVIEHDGREWRASEGALYILSKHRFYNVIVMFNSPDQLSYYINIASPSIKVGNTYEFIDYELDLKKYPHSPVKEIDWGEFEQACRMYAYSEELKTVAVRTMKELEPPLRKGIHPFDDKENRALFEEFLKTC
jgi:protein associated with RNAse G/E